MRHNLYTKVLLCYLLILFSFTLQGQIKGNVYLDSNANTDKSANEKGLADVKIKAFDSKGKIVSETQTDTAGNYLLNVPSGKRVRVEFSNLPDGAYTTPTNFQNGTLTQFITSPTKTSNDLGVYFPSMYDNGSARAVAVSYTVGNGKDSWGDTATAVSLFSAANPGLRFTIATKPQVGCIWGLAYDKNREKLYMSAFAKRHVGYGKLGTGGIYVMDFSSGIISPFLQAGTGLQIYPGEDKHTGLGGVFNNGNRYNNIDSVFFDEVGKTSYGGLDVSEDGNFLFVMNLNTRQMLRIAIPRGDTPIKTTDITTYDFPSNAVGGEARPFAIKVLGNKVYAGVVHDAFKSQKVSDLKAIVYEVNLATKETKEVFSMPLDYPKGYPEVGYYSRRGWYPWTDDFKKGVVPESGGNWAIYPQPILSDIEFDTDGSMVLGFMDRFGHQGATMAQTNDPSLYSLVECGGDIIRVAFVNGKYQLENNGKAGNVTTKGAGNNQGPGGGEYYFEDHFAPYEGHIISEESASGGLAILPSTGELLASHREPLQYNWGTQLQGIRYYSNQKGTYTRSMILPSKGFQKSNGAGDIELVADAPGTEIGNRVWFDCNENGIQEPDEQPVKDVLVELYQNGKKIGTTYSGSTGEYVFNDNNVNGLYGLEIGFDYEVRIALTQPKYKGLQLTNTKSGVNLEIDNDAIVEGENAVIKVKLTGAGQNNYSLDFGFKCIEKPQGNITVSCSGSSDTKDAKITIKGFNPNDRFDVVQGNSYEKDLDYLAAKAIPDNGSIFSDKINLYTPSEYTVRLFNQSCYADFVINTIDNKDCYQRVLATESPEIEPETFVIYPNPASSTINVTYLEKGFEDITIELIDMQGRVLQNKQVRKSGDKYITSFEISDLIIGTYFISVKGKEETISKKFLKN